MDSPGVGDALAVGVGVTEMSSVGEGLGVGEGVTEMSSVGEGVRDAVVEGVGEGEGEGVFVERVGVGSGEGESNNPSRAADEPANRIRLKSTARVSRASLTLFTGRSSLSGVWSTC
jgi:hypothetical protein